MSASPAETVVDRLVGDLSLIVMHEVGALRGHLAAAQVRVRVARRARGVGELLRDQIDLLPEMRNRLGRDHAVRRALWRGLVHDLRRAA
ncbi:MAG: hypothetical protein AB1651_07910 [Pseudomonadota bacterium]